MRKIAHLFLSLLIVSNAAGAAELEESSVTDRISDIYSDIDMQARLAIKANESACSGEQCAKNAAFDALVKRIGAILASSAYEAHPELRKRLANFHFEVAEKKDAAMASNASGHIVVFRGIQRLDLTEEALTFLLAREMGHVIAKHHDKNTSTKIIISVLAGVLFPAITLVSASNVAAQATTATSVATSVASTATSFVGSEVAMSRIKPSQLRESDDVAIEIMHVVGWDMLGVASELTLEDYSASGWLLDLQATVSYLVALLEKEELELNSLEAG